MAYYIARSPSNKLVAIQDEDGQPTQEMYRYINKGFTLYRVSPAGGGAFTLTPLRVAQGTEAFEQTLVGGTLEDDV